MWAIEARHGVIESINMQCGAKIMPIFPRYKDAAKVYTVLHLKPPHRIVEVKVDYK